MLFGLSEQTDTGFDVVVADDGSGPETAAVVARWQQAFGGRLRHVRQEDAGFRLARVKNLGVQAAAGDYLVMIDGDAVPRRGFVAAMRKSAVAGWFVAGKRLELDRRRSPSASSVSACRCSAGRSRAGCASALCRTARRAYVARPAAAGARRPAGVRPAHGAATASSSASSATTSST